MVAPGGELSRALIRCSPCLCQYPGWRWMLDCQLQRGTGRGNSPSDLPRHTRTPGPRWLPGNAPHTVGSLIGSRLVASRCMPRPPVGQIANDRMTLVLGGSRALIASGPKPADRITHPLRYFIYMRHVRLLLHTRPRPPLRFSWQPPHHSQSVTLRILVSCPRAVRQSLTHRISTTLSARTTPARARRLKYGQLGELFADMPGQRL